MKQFSEWFITNFKTYLKGLGDAFKNFFVGLYNLIIVNAINYSKDFLSAAKSFKALDWLIAVPSILIIIMLFVVFILLIIQVLRRYIRFVKKEYSKEELMREIALLNYRVSELTDEKNAVLSLSGSKSIGPSKNGQKQLSDKSNNNQSITQNRFVKLLQVDEKYNNEIMPTPMKDEEKISLSELVHRFVNFAASKLQLYYTPKIIAIYIAGMASSKTMVLEGISGTGKTSLPYAMGKFFKNDSRIISVQPSWRDRTEMIGYLNEFTKKFNETDFLEAIYEATYRTDITFVVLDEMNLARVEYYFADFLSLLEMPHPSEWLVDLVPDQGIGDPIHLKNGKILIPQNIWFVGTANKDDSTFTITDKVYDRVASIEMNVKATEIDAPPTEGIHISYEYLNSLFKAAQAVYKLSDKAKDNLAKLDVFITEKFQITFGNRIMKQIHTFIPVYIACGGDETEGLDYLVARKIIRKFETLNLPFLQKEIEMLIAYINKLFGKNKFNECIKMLTAFHKQI
jgi:hypothetical protein